jgi:glycosyltransferase involved in cell wall biosynthesis
MKRNQETRLRVVFISHCSQRAGGEFALAHLIAKIDVKSHVILGEDGPMHERLRASGVSVEVLEMPSLMRDFTRDGRAFSYRLNLLVESFRYVRQLRRRLRELRPDLIHANSLKAGLCGGLAARFARVPLIWHVREPLTNFRRVWREPLKLAIAVLPHAVIANSNSTLKTVGSWAARHGYVVASAVELPKGRDRNLVVDRLPLRVGMIGRLSATKGQDIFLKAVARIVDEVEVEAIIVGEAIFGDRGFDRTLEALVDQLGLRGRVWFTGYQEDVGDILTDLDLLVHCSIRAEGFGQAIVQAMAAGVPVIASELGAPAEYIEHRRNGLLVEPNSVDALAEALREALSDATLRARLGRCARAIRERVDPHRTASDVLQIYRTVVEVGP